MDLQQLRKIIESKLPAGTTVSHYDEEPIAFGLVALVAHVTMPEEEEGKMDEVEKALQSISEVSQIQVGAIRRLS
jgi:elongation factor 1-beta